MMYLSLHTSNLLVFRIHFNLLAWGQLQKAELVKTSQSKSSYCEWVGVKVGVIKLPFSLREEEFDNRNALALVLKLP